jgi:hypothetical protein
LRSAQQIVCKTPSISKITRVEWTGVVAQAVEHLLCKCKALSPNPSPNEKKKRKKRKRKMKGYEEPEMRNHKPWSLQEFQGAP